MEKRKSTKKIKERGITLIALVITVIVLLILAGVALATLTGDSGILNNAEKAAIQTEIAGIEEEASLIYTEMLIGTYAGGTDGISMSDIANRLNQKGYTIENVTSSGEVTDITLDNSSLSIPLNGTATIKVTLEAGEEESSYYAVIKGKYYKISETNSGIKVEKTPSEVTGGNTGTLTAEVTEGSAVTVGEISGNVINLTAGSTSGTSTITVTYGNIIKTCTVAVKITPTDTSVADATVSFSTDYGRIEVIWLKGQTNEVVEEPNEPNLYTSLESNKLTPVTWTYTEGTDGADGTWTEDTTAKSTWYNYKEGTGTGDNLESMWANAKNTTDAGDSYFVWIPRYAYRITYYENETSTTPTGYYDGWGMWKAENGTVKYELDEGIETVKHNGNKYIVHPAFVNEFIDDNNASNDFLNGGWDTDLTGFWVAKYEMSRKEAKLDSAGPGGYSTTFKSVPSVQSARNIAIGNMYTVSLAYDANKESHMMKNSEWGAVAYLTQSQYGRNGHEIDINNSTTCVTGNGGGAVGGTATTASGVTNYYNSETGAKASSTGNIYGIYDLSGGAEEYVASYDKLSKSSYITIKTAGLYMTENAQDGDGNYISTKYITAYSNGTSETSTSAKLYEVGKVGEATKEVRKKSEKRNWFSDYSNFAETNSPFFARGGYYDHGAGAGAFFSQQAYGNFTNYFSFRVVLCE